MSSHIDFEISTKRGGRFSASANRSSSKLSDHELAEALSVHPERWAAAVQSHGASQLLDLSSSPTELISPSEDDEHLTWLKCVLHQVEGMPPCSLYHLRSSWESPPPSEGFIQRALSPIWLEPHP